ncbi:hypothetical protein HOY80DRAFT_633335 [Tuber brumale]|nr:hypothetical protein HOY80DRAFT_633335 [Tuber brumale]
MQAWHKKEKAKQVKKGKAEKQKLRTEKLARRNPDRIQKQIDELRAIEEGGGHMSSGDRKLLADLQRDLAAVKKAKQTLGGEKVPAVPDQRAGVKRSAGEMEKKDEKRPPRPHHHHRQEEKGEEQEEQESDSGESTSSSVRDIPMPAGTPPPLPMTTTTTTMRAWPRGPRTAHQLPEKPAPAPAPAPAQTTYSAAPVLRDLRKEAAVFVPAAVKRKMFVGKAARGEGDGDGDGDGEEEVEVEGEVEGFVRKRINAAPEVDMEFSQFQAEMEEVADEEA